jgi:UDP-N-acetylmuramate--alanine ligase
MTTTGPWAGRRLHIVAIGGAGMSGLAVVAAQLGASVTGSDRAESPYLEQVRAAGIAPVIGHDAVNVPAGDDVELVFSTAVPADNPERAAARERGLAELHRSALLTQLSALKRTIAITGTHGKTTTTAMTVHALRGCGMDPAFLVGAQLRPGGENAAWGLGEWLVAEADESDRSLLSFEREIAVLLNADLDHHATYASRLELDATLAEFLAPAAHAVVWDRPPLRDLARRSGAADVVVFDVAESDAELSAGGSRFRWRDSDVSLGVPGLHNARNAAAALEACRLAGADPVAAAAALADFPGTARRFEARGHTGSGALVYDDYAHHPAEVAATLAAARTLEPSRLVAVFQPHLYSRTAALAREFGAALAAADLICVLDVYPARERAEDFPGVGGLLVAEAAADAAGGRRVCWLPALDDAARFLATELREGDVCMTLGAGDIDALAARLTA